MPTPCAGGDVGIRLEVAPQRLLARRRGSGGRTRRSAAGRRPSWKISVVSMPPSVRNGVSVSWGSASRYRAAAAVGLMRSSSRGFGRLVRRSGHGTTQPRPRAGGFPYFSGVRLRRRTPPPYSGVSSSSHGGRLGRHRHRLGLHLALDHAHLDLAGRPGPASSRRSTTIVEPSESSRPSTKSASGSSIRRWIARRSGRAPIAGS